MVCRNKRKRPQVDDVCFGSCSFLSVEQYDLVVVVLSTILADFSTKFRRRLCTGVTIVERFRYFGFGCAMERHHIFDWICEC